MRCLAALVLVLALTVPGCGRSGPVRIDTTTRESTIASFKAIAKTLSESEMESLSYDISLLVAPDMLEEGSKPPEARTKDNYDFAKPLHGMTADDIRAKAKAIREAMERGKGDSPPAPKAQP